MSHSRTRRAGFTLIELMIVVAVVAVILVLAAPSFRDMILMQRLRGINAQVMAVLAFARSEAISRGTFLQVRFESTGDMTCYILYSRTDNTDADQCSCTQPAGSRCTAASTVEVRTAQFPVSDSVFVQPPAVGRVFYTIDPRTGGLMLPPVDVVGIPPDEFPVEVFIDARRKFRDGVGLSGRVRVCTPADSTVGGEAC